MEAIKVKFGSNNAFHLEKSTSSVSLGSSPPSSPFQEDPDADLRHIIGGRVAKPVADRVYEHVRQYKRELEAMMEAKYKTRRNARRGRW